MHKTLTYVGASNTMVSGTGIRNPLGSQNASPVKKEESIPLFFPRNPSCTRTTQRQMHPFLLTGAASSLTHSALLC